MVRIMTMDNISLFTVSFGVAEDGNNFEVTFYDTETGETTMSARLPDSKSVVSWMDQFLSNFEKNFIESLNEEEGKKV